MRLNSATMYARVLAGDAACDGRFFFGVTTTGVYCLPSCRARKPRPVHVRFFPSCEAARAAGLRACRKCHPDDFARGADPVLETIEALVHEIRREPAAFADARAIVRRSGFGPTRLFELFRLHFQATPSDLLARARIEAARRALLQGTAPLGDVAAAAGFASLSVFHAHFRRATGLSPAGYRALRSGASFTLALPEGYPLAHLRRLLGRDPGSPTERLEGDVYRFVVTLDGGPSVLRLALSPAAVQVSLPTPAAEGPAGGPPPLAEAQRIVAGLLGLGQDAGAFARLATKLGLERLVAGRPQLRVSQVPDIFDGLVWAIAGQQVNLPFACVLRRRLVERAGTPVCDGLYAPPSPAAVAALDPSDLLPLQFSRQKAGLLVGAARLIAEGRLDLAGLREQSATRAERTLLAVRGLGPWAVHYLMMRVLGFSDCVPLGDTGVTSGLQALFGLEERPDRDATRRLMTVFSPHRSLATAHLWQFTKPPPP